MQQPTKRRDSERQLTTHDINLCPVKDNRRVALRGMRDYKIRRENRVVIVEIHIGDETIIIKVPP